MKKLIIANMGESIDPKFQALEVVEEIKEIKKILKLLIRLMIIPNKTRIL